MEKVEEMPGNFFYAAFVVTECSRGEMMDKKSPVHSYVGFAGKNCCITPPLLCLSFPLRCSPFLIAFIIYPFQTKPGTE